MKKAKIMLMAIAVMGIVGGALAFKAKAKFGSIVTYYCSTTTAPAGLCKLTFSSYTTTLPGLGTTLFCTSLVNNPCPNKLTITFKQ